MIMFFQMFKNSMYIFCSVRGKIMLLRNKNKLLTKTSLRLFYSSLQKTTLKDVILEFQTKNPSFFAVKKTQKLIFICDMKPAVAIWARLWTKRAKDGSCSWKGPAERRTHGPRTDARSSDQVCASSWPARPCTSSMWRRLAPPPASSATPRSVMSTSAFLS